jgi:hypothetical protein
VKDKNIIFNNIPVDITSAGTLEDTYETYLLNNLSKLKLVYIWLRNSNFPNNSIVRDLTLFKNNKTKEVMVRCYQKAKDLKDPNNTRRNANMQYLEDI